MKKLFRNEWDWIKNDYWKTINRYLVDKHFWILCGILVLLELVIFGIYWLVGEIQRKRLDKWYTNFTRGMYEEKEESC